MSYHDQLPTSSFDEELLRRRASEPIRTVLVSETGSEPVTLAQAKAQLSIASSDDAHDTKLTRLITAARQKYEYDTHTRLLAATFDQIYDGFYNRMRLSERPVDSVTSITYYNANNSQQTLSTDVYAFDESLREIRLKPDQSFPDSKDRWDAVTIRYVTGYSTVPETARHAMLLLIAHWFELPDMIIQANMVSTQAYDALVSVHQRSTYP